MVFCFKIVGMRDSIATLTVFTVLLSVISSLVQGDPGGFISIDCGSSLPQWIDSQTNLTWVDDGAYVLTGKNGAVPHKVNSSLDNYEALESFRYFPERRNKHCYELPMRYDNISFLIRAMFLHGSSSELDLPITFDVYVNGTLWTTVKYTMGDSLTEPQVQEGIFFMPVGGFTTYVCLVPKLGVPFISSLELREFDREGVMYSESFVDRQNWFFTNLVRWNTGAPADAPTVRYPDDAYDRLWRNQGVNPDEFGTSEQNASLGSIGSTDSKLNSVPYKVMMDALADGADAASVYLPVEARGSLIYGPAILYFDVVNSSRLDSSTRQLPITVNMDTWITTQTFNITDQPSMKSFSTVLNGNITTLALWGPYVINALEFYQQGLASPVTTFEWSVDSVEYIKRTFNMTSWQGDPCTPVPYDWITCTCEGFGCSVFDAESITLSHLENSSRLMLLPMEMYNTSALNSLQSLYITHSNVDDETFQFILTSMLGGTFTRNLDFSYNNINTFPNTTTWVSINDFGDPYNTLFSLDLSHNHLISVPPFSDFPFSGSLQILNISHNVLMGDSLHHLEASNLTTLRILDISSNSITGGFPSNLLLDAFPSLQNLNAERNLLSGVLNLTIWHQSLLHGISNNFSDNILNRSFSFVENNISYIYPDVNEFETPIAVLIKNMSTFTRTGILLGGNPYCKNAKSFTQRYLCRSSFNDIVYANERKRTRKGLIIGGILGGSLLLFCCVVLFVTTLRLWKQISSLKEVEKELASREVQPPFFSYSDLKLATNDFHHKNELGKGAFGAVYKGILANQTTVAVKRLFNSQKKQVLHEFLNEVVLITGIKHKNLVQLKGCCIQEQERMLIYEYAEKGNLVDALWGKDNDQILDWKDRVSICAGIARGLSYLHEELQPRIIHRDIKPANVLLDKNLNAKIADFGLAKPFLEEDNQADFTHIAGTKGYFSPEYVLEGQLTTKADVYSFGILVLEIISGRKCIDPNQPPDQVYLKSWAEKLQKDGLPLNLLQPALSTRCPESEVLKMIDIALMCVRNDPQHRPRMSQVGIMLLGIMGDKLHSLKSNSSNYPPESDAHSEIVYGSHDIDDGSDVFPWQYGNSTIFEESQEVHMIQTELGPLVRSKDSIGSVSGKHNFATV